MHAHTNDHVTNIAPSLYISRRHPHNNTQHRVSYTTPPWILTIPADFRHAISDRCVAKSNGAAIFRTPFSTLHPNPTFVSASDVVQARHTHLRVRHRRGGADTHRPQKWSKKSETTRFFGIKSNIFFSRVWNWIEGKDRLEPVSRSHGRMCKEEETAIHSLHLKDSMVPSQEGGVSREHYMLAPPERRIESFRPRSLSALVQYSIQIRRIREVHRGSDSIPAKRWRKRSWRSAGQLR